MALVDKVKKKYLENKDKSMHFVPEEIKKKSMAIASLAQWINAMIHYRCLVEDPNYVPPKPVIQTEEDDA